MTYQMSYIQIIINIVSVIFRTLTVQVSC